METRIAYLLTLVYKDGNRWFAGEFVDMDSLNKWLDEEKSREYWDVETQADIQEQVRLLIVPEQE